MAEPSDTAIENGAVAITCEAIGAVGAIRRDRPGAPPGTRDFDLVFSDGHCEPLEVTRFRKTLFAGYS